MAGAEIAMAWFRPSMTGDRAIVASHACDVVISGDDHDYMTRV